MERLAFLSIVLGILSGAMAYAIIVRILWSKEQARKSHRGDRHADPSKAYVHRITSALPLSKAARRDANMLLLSAGSSMTPEEFHARNIAYSALFAFAALAISTALSHPLTQCVVAACAGAIAGWFLQRIALMQAAAKRRREVDSKLPAALDLLSASVTGGLSIERSMEIASKKLEGECAREFARVSDDICKRGFSTQEALAAMRGRCPSSSVMQFCSSVEQAISKGSPLARVLEGQARTARSSWYQDLREKANKLSTKIILVIAATALPAFFIMLLSPVIVQIASSPLFAG